MRVRRLRNPDRGHASHGSSLNKNCVRYFRRLSDNLLVLRMLLVQRSPESGGVDSDVVLLVDPEIDRDPHGFLSRVGCGVFIRAVTFVTSVFPSYPSPSRVPMCLTLDSLHNFSSFPNLKFTQTSPL